MRHVLIFAFLITTCFLAAQEPAPRADTNPSAEAEIKALQLRLDDLIVRGEWDQYAKHLAPDYLHTRDNGRVEGKDEALASLRDVKRKIIFVEAEPADFTIHSYGDAAVSNAQVTVTIRDSGQVRTRVSRQTQVFVKRDGQWWLVAGQDTAIGK